MWMYWLAFVEGPALFARAWAGWRGNCLCQGYIKFLCGNTSEDDLENESNQASLLHDIFDNLSHVIDPKRQREILLENTQLVDLEALHPDYTHVPFVEGNICGCLICQKALNHPATRRVIDDPERQTAGFLMLENLAGTVRSRERISTTL